MILDFFTNNFKDIPVLITGDFNEEYFNDPIKLNMKSHSIDLFT